jgi:ABC-type spermidine/putrescine transport system permease subunit II
MAAAFGHEAKLHERTREICHIEGMSSFDTLGRYVFGSLRRGIAPAIDAIGTLVSVASLMFMILAQLFLRAWVRSR